MSSRPVFVPKNKRRQKKPFFHGAFTGGFSAGYYNTVGSKDGWTPKSQDEQEEVNDDYEETATLPTSKKPRRQQRMEDFMDEEDHNQWGGPTSVKREYDQSRQEPQKHSSSLSMLERVVATEPPPNVGRNLLRVLGWRGDGSTTAIVPLDGMDQQDAGNRADQTPQEQSLLSSKKLRKIRLQQSRVAIPPPKRDVCGLGFRPHANAPEFQRHLEKRQKLARERAKAASGGGGRNVYRASHLLEDDSENDKMQKQDQAQQQMDNEDHNVSYETVQDFVGSKTVGGFALREDDDDVYDDTPGTKQSVVGALKVNDDEYDTVIYEHHSDVEEENSSKPNDDGQDLFGGALASWASLHEKQKPSDTSVVNTGVTSDGRPPLEGFVLGGSTVANSTEERDKNSKGDQKLRFAGPDVPIGHTVKRHEFGKDEHPSLLGDMSRSVQREMVVEQRHAVAVQSMLPPKPRGLKPPVDPNRAAAGAPMAGAAFSGLAAAMKSRFTSGNNKSSTTKEGGTAHPVGLHVPKMSKEETVEEGKPNESFKEEKPAISISRTILPFVPARLVCKRFHVAVPRSIVAACVRDGKSAETEGSEAAFFRDEVLTSASAERARKGTSDTKSDPETTAVSGLDDAENIPSEPFERPSMEVFKSIFEPDSASSDSDEESQDERTDVGVKDREQGVAETPNLAADAPESLSEPPTALEATVGATQSVEILKMDDNKGQGEKHSGKRRHRDDSKRNRRRRQRSDSLDNSSLDDSVDSYDRRKKRKKEKRKRQEKKKRKKHKSSRSK